jgi:hypothetical protein
MLQGVEASVGDHGGAGGGVGGGPGQWGVAGVDQPITGRVNGVGIAGVTPRAKILAIKARTIAGCCFAYSVAAASAGR